MLGVMRVIRCSDAPVFDAGGTTVTAYAAPSRGASELSLWRLELAAGSVSPLHQIGATFVPPWAE